MMGAQAQKPARDPEEARYNAQCQETIQGSGQALQSQTKAKAKGCEGGVGRDGVVTGRCPHL